jgi:Tol biopolymer transport system component
MGSPDMRMTLRQLAIGLAIGGPLLGVLACREEGITTPSGETATAAADIDMAAATTSRIAFIVYRAAGDGEVNNVYTMIPDGTAVRKITNDGLYRDLDWAPGAAKIAAVNGGDIYAINADGSGSRNLTNTPGVGEHQPEWSPDGSKMVYHRGADIYVMNSNGSGQRNLTRSTTFESQPSWSPDGRRIVYISNRRGNTAVHVMNADGSGKRSLTDGASNWESSAVWSPDGRQIAFTASRGGSTDVYVINSDGSGLKNASNHPAGNAYPFWSPNSTKIVFSTNRKGKPEIYVMGRYGGSKTNLTQTPTAEDIPHGWSPGGARILYQISTDIWVMNADGSNKKRIYRGGEEAVWSR